MHTRTPALVVVITVFALLCVRGVATAAEEVPVRVAAGMTATVLADNSGALLDHIVQPIVTVAERADGSRSMRIGSGFVVGRRFYTVQHNIDVADLGRDARRTILIDGVAVSPVYSNGVQDLAVFDLPDELCARMCNLLSFGPMPALFAPDTSSPWTAFAI